ncbi:MAG: hypothetical protein ACON5A_03900, partial [Candidatus Comchoanobacterales bacterium]
NYKVMHPFVLNQSRYDMVFLGFIYLNREGNRHQKVDEWLLRLERIGKNIATGFNNNVSQVVVSFLNPNEGDGFRRVILGDRGLASCEAGGPEISVLRQ